MPLPAPTLTPSTRSPALRHMSCSSTPAGVHASMPDVCRWGLPAVATSTPAVHVDVVAPVGSQHLPLQPLCQTCQPPLHGRLRGGYAASWSVTGVHIVHKP